ncbi:hypothetical protein ACFFX1_50635 [Dactylosporangium sucinum]|uniref:hypothetical protein n=1 Tax=Dactylosporangium sucinum TaxID=1424081 RepID=UPI0035EFFCC8
MPEGWFAPVLAAGDGGAILNVLSAMSWFSYDGANAWSAQVKASLAGDPAAFYAAA